MNKKLFAVIMLVVMTICIFTGCSRNGNSAGNSSVIGPGKTAKNTVSATLTNEDYPSGIQVNWASRMGKSATTLSGLQQLAFAINGTEMIDKLFNDQYINSIKVELVGQTSGKSVTLDTSVVGLVTNLGADSDYFKVDGNTIYFYPHYFSVGEEVMIKVTFTYKADGFLQKLNSGTSVEGYLVFTVGADTQESFSNPLSEFSKKVQNFFSGLGNNSNNGNSNGNNSNNNGTAGNGNGISAGGFTWGANSGSFFEDIEYLIEGSSKQLIAKYEADSQANPIMLKDQWLDMTVYSREASHDIVKVYLELPDGTNITWNNDWFADNCHKFLFDLSNYSGQTVTIRISLLAGSELWQNERMGGFSTIYVPEA